MANEVTHLCNDGSSLYINPLCEHDYFIKACDDDNANSNNYEKGDIYRQYQNFAKDEKKDELSAEGKIKKEVDYLLSLVHRLKEIDFTLRSNDSCHQDIGDAESGTSCKDDNEDSGGEKDIDVSVRDWPWIDQTLCKSETTCMPMTAYDEEQLRKKLFKAIEEANKKNKKLPTDIYLMHRRLHVRKLKRERNLKVFNFDEHIAEVLPSNKCRKILDKYYDSHTVQLPRENILSSGPYPDFSSIVSPYTNRLLKPFIWSDTQTKPPWLKMLNEIKQRRRSDGCEDAIDNHSAPICYTYIRPEHITAINNLCSIYFWPGIDLSESVQYPDFSCIAMYKKLIVGFALMVPDVTATDCYISFLLTRAGWRNSGIATFMLYHLIQTCMGKDITLHVAADNPSLFLYQKFGFKVEQFVKNFYDKYLPLSSHLSKHALFLRLNR